MPRLVINDIIIRYERHGIKSYNRKPSVFALNNMSFTSELQSIISGLRHEIQSLTLEHDLAARDGDLITISDYLLTRLEQLGVTVSILFVLSRNGFLKAHASLFSECPVTSTCVSELSSTTTSMLNSP